MIWKRVAALRMSVGRETAGGQEFHANAQACPWGETHRGRGGIRFEISNIGATDLQADAIDGGGSKIPEDVLTKRPDFVPQGHRTQVANQIRIAGHAGLEHLPRRQRLDPQASRWISGQGGDACRGELAITNRQHDTPRAPGGCTRAETQACFRVCGVGGNRKATIWLNELEVVVVRGFVGAKIHSFDRHSPVRGVANPDDILVARGAGRDGTQMNGPRVGLDRFTVDQEFSGPQTTGAEAGKATDTQEGE